MTNDFLASLKERHEAYERARRELITLSNAAQHASKRAIFAAQRDDLKGAKGLLDEAEGGLAKVGAMTKKAGERLLDEGAYRAALEEYAEARFFLQLIEKGSVAELKGFDEETQIGGLCDAVGELVRRMTVKGTEGSLEDVRATKVLIEKVVAGLTDMDFSGYLRTKYDQARNHLRHAEDILYELSIRRGGRAGA